MTFRKFAAGARRAALALLLIGTVMILVRRLLWGQIPTQVSAFTVYLTVAINCVWIAFAVARGWRLGLELFRRTHHPLQ
jgi:hypothetical protein